MVRLLPEEQKVAVDTVDAADGITAFHCACYHGHAECAAAQMWAAEATVQRLPGCRDVPQHPRRVTRANVLTFRAATSH